MDDNETENAARVLLGMMQTGAFTLDSLTNKYVKLHLTRILKEWFLLSGDAVETHDLPEVFDILSRTERKVMRKMLSVKRRITYSELLKVWDYDTSAATIEKTLKNIRKKLNKKLWQFEISRARYEVKWILKAGKKMN